MVQDSMRGKAPRFTRARSWCFESLDWDETASMYRKGTLDLPNRPGRKPSVDQKEMKNILP